MTFPHMTVAQLIEALKKMPQDLEVFTYNGDDEGWSWVANITTINTQDEFPYCKSDKPDEANFPLVLL